MTEQPIVVVYRDEIMSHYGLKTLRVKSIIRYAEEMQLREYVPIIRKCKSKIAQVVFVRADLYKAASSGDEYAIAKLLYHWFRLNMGRYRVNNNGTYKFTYMEMRRVLYEVFGIDLTRYGRGYPAKFARVVGHLIHFIENGMKNASVIRRGNRYNSALVIYVSNHGGDGHGV
jgi:hypothetical protein